MAFPDAWEEVALVAISKQGGSDIEFAAITETIDISEGDYPGESIPNTAGGRIWKQSPQEDGEITLELYPISLDTTSGDGLFQHFAGGTWDTSQPLEIDSTWTAGVSRVRDKFRIAIMWTDDTAVTSAVDATSTAGSTALRFYATDCRLVSHKASFTDGILKITATFKYPAMSKDAMSQDGITKIGIWQSTSAGGSAETPLTALGPYT
jgi:hypothetical protein